MAKVGDPFTECLNRLVAAGVSSNVDEVRQGVFVTTTMELSYAYLDRLRHLIEEQGVEAVGTRRGLDIRGGNSLGFRMDREQAQMSQAIVERDCRRALAKILSSLIERPDWLQGQRYVDISLEIEQLIRDQIANPASLEDLEHLLAIRPRSAEKLPPVVEVFHDGFANIPTYYPVYATMRALHDTATPDKWIDHNGERVPTHTTESPNGANVVYVSVRGADGRLAPQPELLPALWKQVVEMDDLTSDTFLLCLAQWATQGGEPDKPVWISADAILDARGIQRIRKQGEPGNWQHGHRREDRVEAGRALMQLSNVWVEVRINPAPRAKGSRRPSPIIADCPVLHIDLRLRQEDLLGDYVFLGAEVRPGRWAREYWEQDLKQIGLLAKRALAYDPYRQQPEKRLAKYLAFKFRFDAGKHHGGVVLKVETLLQEANLQPDQRKPQRTRDRLEHALNKLREDRVIAGWDHDQENGELPAKRWLAHWLRWSIVLKAPAQALQQYAHLPQLK